MKGPARLVLINITITIVFLALLNFVSNLALFLPGTIKGLFSKKAEETETGLEFVKTKAELPNFAEDRELARLNFQELPKSFDTQYKAFVAWSRESFQGKTITIDDNGYRLHENKVKGEHRNKSAYFFGGSTMWGYGVADNQTIPAWFNSVSGMPSYNKGEGAFTSRQSLARFVNLLSQGEKIDVAIFYEGINDIGFHCRAELEVNEHSRTVQIREILEEFGENKGKKAQESGEFVKYFDNIFLSGTRQLAGKVSTKLSNSKKVENKDKAGSKRKLSVDESYICDNSQERAQKVAETLVNNWEIAHDIAAARGIKFLAVWQPVAFIGDPKLDHLEQLWNPEWEDELRLQHENVYPILKKVIQERGHEWLLDYTDLFSRDEYIYWDFAHVSSNGNLIIAKQLYKDIKFP